MKFMIGMLSQLAFITNGYSSSMRRLRSASFNVFSIKRGSIPLDKQRTTEFMAHGPPMLRKLVVNDILWEVVFLRP